MQQAVGEDMAAIGVGAELDFVHRDELGGAVERHGFDGTGIPFSVRRDDLLLAGNQRDVARALGGDHTVVVLAREEAQRKPDDAGGVRQQALHRQMRLARVGGAENRLHPGCVTRHGKDVWSGGAGLQALLCAAASGGPMPGL